MKIATPLWFLACAALLAACAAPAAPPQPPRPASEPLRAEERLVNVLNVPAWREQDARELARLDTLFSHHWVTEELAAIAVDTIHPRDARMNALLLLGNRHDRRTLRAFRIAIRSPDPVLRASAAVGLGDVLAVRDSGAIELLVPALRDADPQVQARVLQSLADADVVALRAYLPAAASPELRRVAEELIRLAEARGAPLDTAALVAGGELRRTEAGHALRFRATQAWPAWHLAAGELWLTPAGGSPVRLANDVEVAGGVIPAFFSPDGAYLVYEAGRRIRVRDVRAGTEREIGPGLAPRGLSATSEFVYLVPHGQPTAEREGTRIEYQVMLARFDGSGTPRSLGILSARTAMARHGAASPARWMRIRDRGGALFLEGRGLESFRLPDPLSAVGE